MNKIYRQNIIKQILKNSELKNQTDFVVALGDHGINATQATISRDIKELQLIKVPTANGNYRYSLPSKTILNVEEELQQTIASSFISAKYQDKFVYLNLTPGSGPAVSNLIKKIDYSTVFGILNDDSSVLIICTNAQATKTVFSKINEMKSLKSN